MTPDQTTGVPGDSTSAVPTRDPLSRVAIRQVVLLAVAGTVGFVLL